MFGYIHWSRSITGEKQTLSMLRYMMNRLQTQNQPPTTTGYADQARKLASAGTHCIYGGADTISAGINLMIAACAYAALDGLSAPPTADQIADEAPADMYTVTIFTEPAVVPTTSERPLAAALHQLARHLLTFYASQHALKLARTRLQIIDNLLHTTPDTLEEEIHDAHLYAPLQQQAIWYHLNSATAALTATLQDAAPINVMWHQTLTQLPNQDLFLTQNVCQTLRDIWKERTQDIQAYNLPAFGINNLNTLLTLLQQQAQLPRTVLLFDATSHRALYQQRQEYQHQIATFYS
jgi:hypothetical protein